MPQVIPYIPQRITVHLGAPSSNAANVTVNFVDYVKNVASSEIYPTWEEAALRANILAIVSFALNRVYTEWYRNRGYNFTITSSTAFDHKWIPGRNIFDTISLVVDAWKKQSQKRDRPLSAEDAEGLQNVTSYIADHYAFDIPLERLANIACMSESKLKSCFKRQFGCSVTQYIQGRRMSQAEHLLIDTDFTMGQIAQMIGYTTSSRFAELFKKSTGILPIEYRRIARSNH